MVDILLMLKRRSLCEGFSHILVNSGFEKPVAETKYENLLETVQAEMPRVTLLEVPESGYPNIYSCLSIADDIKRVLPSSKILLMCHERDEKTVQESIDARRANRIDDFIFYDTSMEYLKATLKALM